MEQKIFIIEDDPVIREQLQVLLQGSGYETKAALDFGNAASQVREYEPHLVLLDIKLPGVSGFSICSQIRSFSQVPIIFVTSSNTDMDELNSIMLGGDAFITKPYNTPILLAKIQSLIQKSGFAKKAETGPSAAYRGWRLRLPFPGTAEYGSGIFSHKPAGKAAAWILVRPSCGSRRFLYRDFYAFYYSGISGGNHCLCRNGKPDGAVWRRNPSGSGASGKLLYQRLVFVP